MFSQLPYKEKAIEGENRMFRSVLDACLYDMTSNKIATRFEMYDWLSTSNVDFIEVCKFASLDITKTYNMYMYFLKKYFTPIYTEFTCYKDSDVVSLKNT